MCVRYTRKRALCRGWNFRYGDRSTPQRKFQFHRYGDVFSISPQTCRPNRKIGSSNDDDDDDDVIATLELREEREMEGEFRIRREEWRGVIIVSSNPYPGSNRNENRASRKIGVPAYTVHNMHEWMIARDYRLAWRDIAESIRFGVLSFFIREPLVRNEEWNICNCWNIKWNILYVLGILRRNSVSFLFFVVAKD